MHKRRGNNSEEKCLTKDSCILVGFFPKKSVKIFHILRGEYKKQHFLYGKNLQRAKKKKRKKLKKNLNKKISINVVYMLLNQSMGHSIPL